MLMLPIRVKMTGSEARPKLSGNKDDRDYRLRLSSSRQFARYLFLSSSFNIFHTKSIIEQNPSMQSHIFELGLFAIHRRALD